jgi:hypothetical protein
MKGSYESLQMKVMFMVFPAPRNCEGPTAVTDLQQDLEDSRLHGLVPGVMLTACRNKPEGLTLEDVGILFANHQTIPKGTRLLAWKQL